MGKVGLMASVPPLEDSIPFLDPGTDVTPYELATPAVVPPKPPPPAGKTAFSFCHVLIYLLFIAAFAMHCGTIYRSLGGWAGLTSPHPILKDDHPLYLHSAVVTKAFLKQSLSTAGYDPTFMAGYAKSAVFPASSTLPEVVVAATTPVAPAEVAYKFYVLASSILAPILVAWATGSLLGSPAMGMGTASLYLIYIWIDFPSQYISFGMLPYFLSIPVALLCLAFCCKWLEQSRLRDWAAMTALLCLAILVHFTSLMVLGPAALAAWSTSKSRLKKALGGLSSFLIAALVNAFWWYPGVVMAATKGDSGFAFSHSGEGLLARLSKIAWNESPVQPFLWLGLAAGLPLALKVRKTQAAGLAGLALGGFFWGYGAGAFPGLDFLQPGRHTYAFYLAASAFTVYFIASLVEMTRRANRYSAVGLVFGITVICTRVFGPSVQAVTKAWANPATAPLSSAVPPLYTAIYNALKLQVSSGERVLYEEGGQGPDIYEGGRYSGVLARALGVEFIGGPYLHAALKTNVVQFGEGKLCGRPNWDMALLEQLRQRYGLGWVVAFSDHARTVIDANPDHFQVTLSQGPLRVARLIPQPISAKAVGPRQPLSGGVWVEGDVLATPGGLRLGIKPNSGKTAVDRQVVLRYHWVPNLRVVGSRDVSIQPAESPEATLPPLLLLKLGPDAAGVVEIQLNPWGD